MKTDFRRSFDRALARRSARRLVTLPADFPPSISFSFDDFPSSSVEIAEPILASAGVRATWYACVGLLGGTGACGPIASVAQVQALHAAGHEIGNHTYSHIDAHSVAADVYGEDIARNRRALDALSIKRVTSFSYPFGGVTAKTKRIASEQATTCRGIFPGIARGSVDLALLPANPLYSATIPLARILTLIEDLRLRGGWAHLYTHDVSQVPSPWGCTPADFEAVVAAAIDAGIDIRPVGDVADRIAGRGC